MRGIPISRARNPPQTANAAMANSKDVANRARTVRSPCFLDNRFIRASIPSAVNAENEK